MSWRPRPPQSKLDPAWRLLGVALILPTVGQVASGNLLYLGDLDTGGGHAWVAYQLLALTGLVVGARVVLDGRWRGAALALALAWIVAHVAYDLVLTDTFARFGERVVIPRPWVFAEAVPMAAWLAGLVVVGGTLAAKGISERATALRPAMRRLEAVGLAAMLRGR
jgi:hypothetical protein